MVASTSHIHVIQQSSAQVMGLKLPVHFGGKDPGSTTITELLAIWVGNLRGSNSI